MATDKKRDETRYETLFRRAKTLRKELRQIENQLAQLEDPYDKFYKEYESKFAVAPAAPNRLSVKAKKQQNRAKIVSYLSSKNVTAYRAMTLSQIRDDLNITLPDIMDAVLSLTYLSPRTAGVIEVKPVAENDIWKSTTKIYVKDRQRAKIYVVMLEKIKKFP
jgi:uncharacterized coiled-coil DUF342 family protein